MPLPDCSFCRKLADLKALSPAELVWEFPQSVALLGPWQYYHGYCLLVARQHATELNHLLDADRRAYLDEMCLLAQAMEGCFKPRKLNYELLGNQVPHLHWHLFPRYRDDLDHLKPVWLSIEYAEHLPLEEGVRERLRMQTGRQTRQETAEVLRKRLRELTGTP